MRVKLVLSLIVCLSIFQLSLSAQSVNTDSLDLVLKNLPDKSKLIRLDELAKDTRGRNSKIYADKLLRESERQKNIHYKGNALFALIQHYYTYNIDSMRILMAEAEPIFRKEKRMEDLFRMKAWNIYACSRRGENDQVIQEVEALDKLSVELDYPEGKEMSDQALADYYGKNRMFKESLALLVEVFRHMEARNAPLIKRINVIRQIQNMGSGVVDANMRLYYLEKLEGYIKEYELEGIVQIDELYSLPYIKYLYHRFYTLVGLELDDKALILSHLQEAEHLVRQYELDKEKNLLKNLRISYFNWSGQYEQAILVYDELLESYRKRGIVGALMPAIRQQGYFYHKTGRYAEAVRNYEEYIALSDSVGLSKYNDELARLKVSHDVDKQTLKIQALELESSRARLWQVITLLVVLFILCVCSVYIAYSRQRHNRLLQKAKEKAEESDRLKSAFLANINHEIRTPLNAIIGFSEVLIDEEEEDLRRQYVDVIRENNRMLQQLIDGILSVSSIESESVSFDYTKVALPELMNDVFKSAKVLMTGNVIVDYILGTDIKMKTDRTHLSRILLSVLTFAIRRSQEGVIRLGYTTQDNIVSFYVQNLSGVISEEEREALFDYQLMLKSWTKGVGMGVNLEFAVAKNLIDRMGGSLKLITKEAEGFAFYINFPL